MFIKDILTIDLTEDIKNVIDLEDVSEAAIQNEIENYIITNNQCPDSSVGRAPCYERGGRGFEFLSGLLCLYRRMVKP